MWDLGEYLKCGIRASTRKGKIRASTRKVGSERVSEIGDPGEYRKCGIWASASKGKIRASTRKGRIRASIGNRGSGRVPEKVKSG